MLLATLVALVPAIAAARPDPLFRTGLENYTCGNQTIEDTEQCDDGNPTNGDGCPTNCRLIQCGDGEIEPLNEECDDGPGPAGTQSNDGCAAEFCEVEFGWSCVGEPSDCMLLTEPPSVSSVDYPVIAHGGKLQVTGVNFSFVTAVSIGGVAQSFVAESDNDLAVSVGDTVPLGGRELVVTNAAGSSAPFAVTVIRLLVNELDSDTAGTDVLEFVEIATGVAGVNLSGYALTLWNGTGDVSYLSVNLDGTTDGNGLIVVGNLNVNGVDVQIANNIVQNGPDAAGIYQQAPHANGTPVTAVNLIDALVYDTADADDAELLDTLLGTDTPGRIQLDEGGFGVSETQSIQRCETSLRRDGRSFATAAPTASAGNADGGCVL